MQNIQSGIIVTEINIYMYVYIYIPPGIYISDEIISKYLLNHTFNKSLF